MLLLLTLLRSYAGKDIKTILADPNSHEHSAAAYEILDEYHIGFMVIDAASGLLPPTPPLTPNPNPVPGTVSAEDMSVPTDIVADYRKNKFLDLSRPLLMQIWFGGFSKEFYLEQVHKPRHYKGGESAPLFGNFLEPLSKTPWYVVPIIWLPCVAYGTFKANEGLPSIFLTALLFLLGIGVWSLVEYGMHRCLFHVDEYVFLCRLVAWPAC